MIGRSKKRYYHILPIIIFIVIISMSACSNDSSINSYQDTDKYTDTEDTNINQQNVLDGEAVAIEENVMTSWEPLEGGDSEESIINNSVLIVKGIPLANDTEVIGGKLEESGFPFTVFKFKVSEIIAIKRSYDSIIKRSWQNKALMLSVRMNGAVIDSNNKSYIIHDAPLMELGKEYLLFLRYDKDIDMYWPVGGRLGVAEVGRNGLLHFTSERAAKLCDSLEGKESDKTVSILIRLDTNDYDFKGLTINVKNELIPKFLE